MNSEIIKTSDPHRRLLDLSNKINLKSKDKYVALSNLSICYTWKNIKKSYINNNFKTSTPRGMKSLNYLMDHILHQVFRIIFKISLKKYETITDNISIMTYINKIENRITFEATTGYHLELLTPETMELLERTKSKITKDKSGKNVPHLEIAEVVLILCNIVNNNYQQDSTVLYIFVPNKSFWTVITYFTQGFHIFKIV